MASDTGDMRRAEMREFLISDDFNSCNPLPQFAVVTLYIDNGCVMQGHEFRIDTKGISRAATEDKKQRAKRHQAAKLAAAIEKYRLVICERRNRPQARKIIAAKRAAGWASFISTCTSPMPNAD